jgi:thiamine kinase-like enzyme
MAADPRSGGQFLKPTIETILESIPAWQSTLILNEPLHGGLTNDTYKVLVGNSVYVVRINGTQNLFLGLNRTLEQQAIEQAYALGIAPQVFRLGNPEEVLITGYLPGGQVTHDDAHTVRFINELAGLLKKAHSIEGVARYNNPFTMIDRYITSAESLGVSRLETLAPHLHRMNEIARQYNCENKMYCHNDIFVHNLLWDEGHLRAIDWELSGYGDEYFELASIACSEHYTPSEECQLLGAYFGEYDDEMQHRLQAMRYVGLIREIALAMLMVAIVNDPVNHTMDYVGFQKYVIDRLDAGFLSV